MIALATALLLQSSAPAPEPLRAAATAAGDWLLSMQRIDGAFWYGYDPRTDNVSDQEYNDVRHAGVTWSLLVLYRRTQDCRYLVAAERALDWLARHTHVEQDLAFVLHNDRATLGATALALVALAEHAAATNSRTYLPLMEQLGRHLLSQQRPDGSFEGRYQFHPRARPSTRASLYYPGEAILALVRLHALTQDNAWLQAATKGMEEILGRYAPLPLEEIPHDHWVLIALPELVTATNRQDLARAGLRIADTIVRTQYGPDNVANAAWVGGFREEDAPRYAPAATRAEGLIGACRLAKALGDPDARYREAIGRTSAFLLAGQVTPELSRAFANPTAAVGVIPHSPADPRTRIDYAQHTICALLGYEELLSHAR